MKNWQKNRNYKRIKDENGNVIANIITIDGIDVEVTEEVFLAYSQMDRRERYFFEENGVNKELSLEQMSQDRVQLSYVGAEMTPRAVDVLSQVGVLAARPFPLLYGFRARNTVYSVFKLHERHKVRAFH